METEGAEKLICMKCKGVNSFELAPMPGKKKEYVLVCGICGFVAVPGTKARLTVNKEGVAIVAEIGHIDQEGDA